MDFTLQELNNFLGKAALATYAGGGKQVDPSSPGFISRFPGFKELEYKEGDFYYRDSYAGFSRSAGQEVVFYKEKPAWAQCYYGGMEQEYCEDEKFARETFDFLKNSLSYGEKRAGFQPRGPKEFAKDDWKYSCNWQGDLSDFKGDEKIYYKDEIVFTHNFFGGLLRWKNDKGN